MWNNEKQQKSYFVGEYPRKISGSLMLALL